MKFSVEIFYVIFTTCLISHAFSQCQQTCIPVSLEKEYRCSDIADSRPFEVKQPGRCSKQNSEARNAICCTNSDAWLRYNVKTNQEEPLVISRGAFEGEFPHQVYIQRKTGSNKIRRCSGTVYNKNFVLTTAGCLFTNNTSSSVDPNPNEKFTVFAASSSGNSEENSYAVNEVFLHPRFDDTKLHNGYDIALLRLKAPLDYANGKIGPLRIASKDFIPNYKAQAIVLDWNNKVSAKTTPKILKSFAPLHDPDTCQRIFGEDAKFYNVLNHQLCVAGDDSGLNVLDAEIGGSPLICPDPNRNNKPVLCGISSYKPCPSCKSPAIFTRISSFADWIKKTTKNEPQEIQNLPDESIGGQPEDPEDFLVRIFAREKTCDGTLLSPNVIVTAKNCIVGTKNLGSLVIVHARTKVRLIQSVRKVDASYSSFYAEIGNENSTNILRDNVRNFDLAFLKLEEPFKINYYPQIPPDHYAVKDAVEMSYSLKTNNLELRNYRIIEKNICKIRYDLLKVKVHTEMLCAAENYSGGSTCERGLGSPLICEGKYLCGIASSRGCSFAFPNIFTDVTELNDGINEAIEKLNGKLDDDN